MKINDPGKFNYFIFLLHGYLMICFFPFLILICCFSSCLSWLIENKDTNEFKLFKSSKELETIIKEFKWNQSLEISENFVIFESNMKGIDHLQRKKASSKIFTTLLDYSHYRNLIEAFGNILFDDEMNKNQIIGIFFTRKSENLEIGWNTLGQISLARLAIQKAFKKHFPFLKDNEAYHTSLPIFKKISLIHKENIKTRDKGNLFKDKGNFLQIYNKRDAKFNGLIILTCSLNLSLNSLTGNNIFEITVKNIKKTTFEKCSRFGVYIGKGESLLKSFAFYQFNSTNSSEIDIQELKEFFDKGLSLIYIDPPKTSINLDQLLDFIINMAFQTCQ